MKQTKIYNIFFPTWFLLFFPPVVFITLITNFFADSFIVVLCYYIFRLSDNNLSLKNFYRKSIIKVFVFGFFADLIGAAMLFILDAIGDYIGLSNEVIFGINYDPFNYPTSSIIILCAIVIASIFIFIFNFKIGLKDILKEKLLRVKVALTIALTTMPWTFLLPTKLFYHSGLN